YTVNDSDLEVQTNGTRKLTLTSQVVLASFIPMLMDLGGNCGAQSSTLIIRGMAVGEIELTDWLQVIWKELCVGGMVAAALCLVNWLRMLLFVPELSARANLAVNATLFLTVCFSKLLGAALPMMARKAGRDPAMVSSPLLTTVIDSVCLLLYFWIASMLLPG
ncbi:MAG: magnesium transporter, partial [Victivallales bacterium]|nr:magnesium transporter [Victivallales bacterium]